MQYILLDHDLGQAMSNRVQRAYQLLLTHPVTSCSCEGSFSALNLVKKSQRSTMAQTRLGDIIIQLWMKLREQYTLLLNISFF